MKFHVAALAVVVAIGAPLAYAQEENRVRDAALAAGHWLGHLDHGDWSGAWHAIASTTQASGSEIGWTGAWKQVRAALGPVQSRRLVSASFMRSIPNAPDGEYVVLQYKTRFANRAETVETVTPMRDKDGSWKVSGYYVR